MQIDPKFGYVLQEKVDLEFLKSLEPQNFPDMIKVVVNKDTGYVAVGMRLHASAQAILGDSAQLWGANIYYETGDLVWESTLNEGHNEDLGKTSGAVRVIDDPDTVEMLNGILSQYVEL